jgi:pimeloyl-ACP methyl ester carboxylesterase
MKMFKTAALAIAFTLGAGAAYQQAGQAADRAVLSPPGRLVPVGDGHMHLHCDGHGGPTVLLEAGATGFAQTWAWVQRDLAHEGRVCAYDRAGLGWSDSTPQAHDGASTARRLKAMLTAAGESGPYVVVGHSLGGPLVQIFAAQYADDVVAQVLVDPSHPDQLTRFPADARKQQESFSSLLRVAELASHVGLTRVTNIVGRNAQGLPDADDRAARMFASSPTHLATSREELMAWEQTMAQVREHAPRSSTPLVVISAGATMGGMPDGFLDVVHELHRDIVARASGARHVVIRDADHFSLLMNREHARRVAEEISQLRRRLGGGHQEGPAVEPAVAKSSQPSDSL